MDLTNPNNWSKIYSTYLKAALIRQYGEGVGAVLVFEELQPVYSSLATPVGLVNLSSPTADPKWFTGCYLNAYIGLANQRSRIYSRKCGLKAATPIFLPVLGVVPYEIEFVIPKWIEDLYIDLWQFTDQSGRYVEASQQAIMSAIEVVEQRELELQAQLIIIEQQVETVIDLTGTRDFTINVE